MNQHKAYEKWMWIALCLALSVGIFGAGWLNHTFAQTSPETLYIVNHDLYQGKTLVGEITSRNGDEWTVYGCETDLLTVTMQSDLFSPYLEVLDPTYELVGFDGTAEEGEAAFISPLALPETGLYTIFADGERSSDRGVYSLTVTLNGASIITDTITTPQETPDMLIGYGESVRAEMRNRLGSLWGLRGCAGDVITVTMSSGVFTPSLELYGNDDADLLAIQDTASITVSEASEQIIAQLAGVVLDESGYYVLVTQGTDIRARGAYTVSVVSDLMPDVIVYREETIVTATPTSPSTSTPESTSAPAQKPTLTPTITPPPVVGVPGGFPTPTPSPTNASSESNTPTITPVPTNTPTFTPVPMNTPTATPTFTPVATNTLTTTPTFTPVPTNTPTTTPTFTLIPPTNTPTNTPTLTPPPLVGLPGGFPGADEWDGQVFTSIKNIASNPSGDPVFIDQLSLNPVIRRTPGNLPLQKIVFIFRDDSTGQEVHRQEEFHPAYCSFGGGEPNCNILFLTAGVVWPSTRIPVTNGDYEVNIQYFLAGDNPNNPSGDSFMDLTIASPALRGQAQPIPTSPAHTASFDGTWETNIGPVTFTQNGNRVTGVYQLYGDTSRYAIGGTVFGNVLEGSYEGFDGGEIRFVLSRDGQSFDGQWRGQYHWCGVRTARHGTTALQPGCGYSGEWQTLGDYRFDYQPTMSLTQVGDRITGTFLNGIARTKGTIAGNVGTEGVGSQLVAVGRWTINDASGTFRWQLVNLNSDQFQGYSSGRDGVKRQWCGWRQGIGQPARCLGE
ncbi:MAG: hypothetical protein AAF639_07700 [Chloroflexota bacterium]